jgi:replicative DNA helicase
MMDFTPDDLDVSTYVSIDAEREVLHYLLIEPNSYQLIEPDISEEYFSVKVHREVFKAIKSVYITEGAHGFLNVAEYLEKTNTVSTPRAALANLLADFHYQPISEVIATLRDRFMRRRVIGAVSQIKKQVGNLELSAKELLDKSQQFLFDIEEKSQRYATLNGAAVGAKAYDYLTSTDNYPKFGWYSLDAIIDGIRPNVHLIVGATGMGKSSFMIATAMNMMLKNNWHVLYISPEMTSVQISLKMLSNLTGLNAREIQDIRRNPNDSRWAKVIEAIDKINNLPLHINDDSSPSMQAIKAEIRKIISKIESNKLIVFVDYLQQLPALNPKSPTHEDLGNIAQMFDVISKDFNIPIFIGSQENRATESTNDKIPTISSVMGSSTVTQKAAVIIGLLFPAYYARQQGDMEGALNPRFLFYILKNRFGDTGVAELDADLSTCTFEARI